MLLKVSILAFYFIPSAVSSSINSVQNSREEILQYVIHNPGQLNEDNEMSNILGLVKTNSLSSINLNGIADDGVNSRDERADQYTIYDIIFLSYFIGYVIFVVYTRAKTHYRVDYSDGDWSFFSLVTSYRKAFAPDGSIDRDLRKSQDSNLFANNFLIALAILWFGLNFCNYDELLSEPKKHIEDVYGLLSAMLRYFVYILGVCYVFDVCLAPPYCYYE